MPRVHGNRMREYLRRFIQVISTFLLNGYWYFPISRAIYQGPLKSICAPGLNCHSCPAATTACPLGAIQNFMASMRVSLQAARYHFGLYVLGWLGMIGGLVGRLPCGWICPFGLIQDLLFKIPGRKFKLPGILSYGPYVFLGLTVFILPFWVVDAFGYGFPWFCEFICPAGTLEAGLPLLALQPTLRTMVGYLFLTKLAILFLFVIWSILASRPFCRSVCPLGAFYSFFNRVSLFQLRYHAEKCTHCDQCYRDCPVDIKVYESPNDRRCIRCLICMRESCTFEAISYEMGGFSTRLPGLAKRKRSAAMR